MINNLLPITRPSASKIQLDFQSLPTDTPEAKLQTINYLTKVSQGAVPDLSPYQYVALGVLNDLKQQAAKSQQGAGAPPAGPLNQIIPQEAKMAMGVGSLAPVPGGAPAPGGAPPPVGAAPGGAPPPQPAPGGAPAPGAQMPTRLARGGLASIPVDDRMFDYGSGGIIAFQSAGAVPPAKDANDAKAEDDEELALDAATERADEDATDVEGFQGGAGDVARARLDQLRLRPEIAAALTQKAPTIRSREAIEAERPGSRYGIAAGPIGERYLKEMADIDVKKQEDIAKRKENLEDSKRMAIYKALMDAGEASRGNTGIGAMLAGAGRSLLKSREDLDQQESGFRQEQIKDSTLMAEARNKFDDLRRAKQSGDITAIQKNETDLAKIAKDLGVSKNALIGKLAGANASIIGKGIAGEATIGAARERAKGAGREPRYNAQQDAINIYAEDIRAEHGPDSADPWPEHKIKAEALRRFIAKEGSPAADTVAARVGKEASDYARKQFNRSQQKFRADNPGKSDAQIQAILVDEYKERVKNKKPHPTIVGTPSPAAPAASKPQKMKFNERGELVPG